MKRPAILLIAIFISLVSMAEKRFQTGDFCYQVISETDKKPLENRHSIGVQACNRSVYRILSLPLRIVHFPAVRR